MTLKLFKPGQLIEVGFCPDLGRCQVILFLFRKIFTFIFSIFRIFLYYDLLYSNFKGRKASDGDQCSNFVNASRSLYCPFHIQQRARLVAAKRGTLNRSSNLPTKEYRLKTKGQSPQKERPPPELVVVKRKPLADENGKK